MTAHNTKSCNNNYKIGDTEENAKQLKTLLKQMKSTRDKVNTAMKKDYFQS